MMILPCPLLPLAQHARFGQNCSDGSIGSVLVSICTFCRGPSKFSSLSPLSPVNGAVPDSLRVLECVKLWRHYLLIQSASPHVLQLPHQSCPSSGSFLQGLQQYFDNA